MTDAYEHNPGDHEDPVPGPTWIIAFISIVLLVVTLLGLTALYYEAFAVENETKVVDPPPILIDAVRGEQLARLAAPAHREQRDANGQVETSIVIPIDEAIKLTVKEYTSR